MTTDDRMLEYLEYSILLTLFAIAVVGLLGMAGVPGMNELLVRVLFFAATGRP